MVDMTFFVLKQTVHIRITFEATKLGLTTMGLSTAVGLCVYVVLFSCRLLNHLIEWPVT